MPLTLQISRELSLPAEAVSETFAILAKRGAGKTYTAAVMVEELLKAGLQVVVVDPVGVWWGLRASADGTREGLPIAILGGEHGDVPLDVAAGEIIANVVVEEGLSVVLDLSHCRKGEQTRFMTDFAERLYYKNREPLHLVLDEADAFAPQRPMKGQERLLGAIEDLVRRGRARGLGVTLVTQRAAVLNKDVLT
jgi:DNA helicase HerA-like ATPase